MHLHYIVWAYDRVEPQTGNFINNVTLDLLAKSEAEALKRASTLVKKPNYCVRGVIEHFDGQPCGRA